MYIKRHIEQVVQECISQFLVTLVTGPRQIGKTTMLKTTYEDFAYVTFDDPLELQEAMDDPKLFLKNHPIPLMIDEVQYAPDIFRIIKLRVDQDRTKGSFLLTGSQIFPLMKNVSETLAGRMAIIEMQSLSIREQFNVSFYEPFLPTIEYIKKRKKQILPYLAIWNIIQRGSMPELMDSQINWKRYYASYVKTYIERDVRNIANISDELKFIKFLTVLASRCGELLNYNAVAEEVETSVETIKRWVSILRTSGIIFLLEPYANNIIKRVVKTPKLYFYDTGLVSYLTRWNSAEALRTGAKAGNIFENFIISEIMKSYLNAGETQPPLYFYRDKDKKEIDLIIEQNGILYPIEIKMSAQPTKSMAKAFPLLQQIPNKQVGLGVILCQIDELRYLSEDVIALPIEYI